MTLTKQDQKQVDRAISTSISLLDLAMVKCYRFNMTYWATVYADGEYTPYNCYANRS